MFRTTTTKLAGVAVVVCAFVAAPQAFATTNVHGAKASAKRVHRVTPDEPVVAAARLGTLSFAFADACKAGLIGDRTMGVASNSYDYFGDPCTS